jgi:hypothetical protein
MVQNVSLLTRAAATVLLPYQSKSISIQIQYPHQSSQRLRTELAHSVSIRVNSINARAATMMIFRSISERPPFFEATRPASRPPSSRPPLSSESVLGFPSLSRCRDPARDAETKAGRDPDTLAIHRGHPRQFKTAKPHHRGRPLSYLCLAAVDMSESRVFERKHIDCFALAMLNFKGPVPARLRPDIANIGAGCPKPAGTRRYHATLAVLDACRFC